MKLLAAVRTKYALALALTGAILAMALTSIVAAPKTASAATIDPNAYYTLVSRHSGKAMDVAGLSTADGAGIQQWARSGGTNQQFQFVDSGGGYYRIKARHSGKVLDIYEWNAADGAQVVQFSDLNGTNQQFQVLDSDSGYVRFINRFSGKALDVWEWSSADGGRISQFTDLNGWNQQWQLVRVDGGGGGGGSTGLVGWATQGGGTTGGGNASPVTVTSGSALISAMQSSSPAVIRVQGMVSFSGMQDVASNKTIIGVGSGSGIQGGGGLDIDGASNVIIQNLNFRNWSDDAINVQDGSTRIWIDHNSFSNGYDGAVDIKRGSDYATVSWNRFFDHDKTMLLGHSDDNGSQDRGHLRVTYHHNWFDGTNQRHPRVRFGNPVHVYNNYYGGVTSYGVASTMEAGVLVEGNYFENTNRGCDLGQGSSPAGSLVQRNNVFVNSGACAAQGSVAGIPYSYSMDSASSVKSIVTSGAGAGRI